MCCGDAQEVIVGGEQVGGRSVHVLMRLLKGWEVG